MRTLLLAAALCVVLGLVASATTAANTSSPRKTEDFDKGWRFHLGDVPGAQELYAPDSLWRVLDLPHDWSIEGPFSKDNPATPSGGALPGGIGWYRKTFTMPDSEQGRLAFIEFDGVYRNSQVWINGDSLGVRPYGYSSFRYELTKHLKYNQKNVIAVRVDNSQQPNSRWYSGSGIYRNVRLVTTSKLAVDQWGTFITTPSVSGTSARVTASTRVRNATEDNLMVVLRTDILSPEGVRVATNESRRVAPRNSVCEILQSLNVERPELWGVDRPRLYRAVTTVESGGQVEDRYETTFGIRTFTFDKDRGFFLNGVPMKINGVCNHHDLGCLGAAVNTRALERQLEILKAMGANAIRTSHNPPAPELLDLCDKMGFLVMDEAFDMWRKKKTDYDYALNWDQWHARDLEDMVLRDRNHPSIILWSIGNEIVEQWDKKDNSGINITRELAGLVRALDPTRPITSNCNDADPSNPLIRSGALDIIGFSYAQNKYAEFPAAYPGMKLIGSETTSALATRGHYDMPSDTIRRWPKRWDVPFVEGNKDFTCSSYDNCSAPWGSTHEETLKLVKKYPFVSGMFVWTGFDYLGEPTPYGWPARSSYFGIVDLAGFPKDAYYLYQSEWTDKPMLHLFPHWNWKRGDTVDVWAYTNYSEVELFLNGKSLGAKRKTGDEMHLMWRVPYTPGRLSATGRNVGKPILIREVRTAGPPAKLDISVDRAVINADGSDLAFVTVRILDSQGTLVPDADNLIQFSLSGDGSIAGLDNGQETSLESFQGTSHHAFNGLCLAVVRSTEKAGRITLQASTEGLAGGSVTIESK